MKTISVTNKFVLKLSVALGITTAIMSETFKNGFRADMFTSALAVEMLVRMVFFYIGYSIYYAFSKKRQEG